MLLLCVEVVCTRASVPGGHAVGCLSGMQSMQSVATLACCSPRCSRPSGDTISCAFPPVQPYFPGAAAALLAHMAPSSVRQPCLPVEAPPAVSSSEQVQSLDAAGQATQEQLKAADSALLAAQQAAAAAAAAAAALVAAQAGAPQQLPPQQPLTSPSHQQPVQVPLARSPEATMHLSDLDARMQQHTALRPPSSGARPGRSERPPPGLQVEPSLPDHDMPPGKLHHASADSKDVPAPVFSATNHTVHRLPISCSGCCGQRWGAGRAVPTAARGSSLRVLHEDGPLPVNCTLHGLCVDWRLLGARQ